MKNDIINGFLIAISCTVIFSIVWIDVYMLKKYFPDEKSKIKIESLEHENSVLKDNLRDCVIKQSVHL